MTPDDTSLRLSLPDAYLVQAAADFARDGHVRLCDIFSADTASAIHRHLDCEVEWWRAVNNGDKIWDIGPESIAAMADGKDGELMAAVHKGARDGFQFLFDTIRVPDEAAERHARDLLLDRLVSALNHPASIATFRSIIGNSSVRMVDGQATRYLPGHFLTSHDDDVVGKGRTAAYVLNLTPQWRTEWGGLLQFHDAQGDITRALKPCFNTLHLFKVPQVHSVSLVAPFAGAPRYAITGWLRL
jgi:SM-20-related protein